MTSIVPSQFKNRQKSPFSFTEEELNQDLITDDSTILSFSEKIESINLLRLLKTIFQYYSLHFYWENQQQQESILAFGLAQYLVLDQGDRFQKSQRFLDDCFNRIVCLGDCSPHLFLSFTFFENQKLLQPSATIFLPTYEIVRRQETYYLIINVTIDEQENIAVLRKQFFDHLEKSLADESFSYPVQKYKLQSDLTFNNSADFIAAVELVLRSIDEKKLSKVVLAHALDIYAKANFNIIEALKQLRLHYSDSHIFSFGNSTGEAFLGASPERLISIRNKQLVTDALAGSAPRGKTIEEDILLAQQLLTNEKEIREHQSVKTFINSILQELGIQPECSGLKILQLSNIQHLWTSIYAHLPPSIQPLEILQKLHPTPAVAGVPTNIACDRILEHEKFDRGLYAAPLGWIDCEGNCEFIVGIRSALIRGNHARLYAGAGIVSGSDPYRELAEIELKFQVLLRALGY